MNVSFARSIFISLVAVTTLLPGVSSAEPTLLMDDIVNRKEESAYIISNLPESDVMRPVCRQGLNRQGKCHYIALSEVDKGKSGALLSYNWREKNETVIVVDSSRLDNAEKVTLSRLKNELFPAMTEDVGKQHKVAAYVQNVGKNAMQALVIVPRATLLQPFADELWTLHRALVSRTDPFETSHPVYSASLLTNDDASAESLLKALRYSDVKQYGTDGVGDFLSNTGADLRVIALDWNAAKKCSPSVAASILPAELSRLCKLDAPDGRKLTSWDRFCREANASFFKGNDSTPDTWVIRAPTQRHLRSLVSEVTTEDLKPGEHKIELIDLSGVKSMAVGVCFVEKDIAREQLVLAQEIETATAEQVKSEVKITHSSQDWGKLVQDAFGSQTAHVGAEKVVKASGSDALLLLRVREIEPTVEFKCIKERITPPVPEFRDQEPSRPSPDERKYGIAGPKKYPGDDTGDRERSSDYKRDMRRWRDDHYEWERKKRDYEYECENRQVDWRLTVLSYPSARVVADLSLIDLASSRQIWSTPTEANQSGESTTVSTKTVRIRGDKNEPVPVVMAEPLKQWRPDTYLTGQNALTLTLRQGVDKLMENALWASDIRAKNP